MAYFRASQGGGRALTGVMHPFSAKSTVDITCNIGDMVVVAFSRSASTTPTWNNVAWTQSPDFQSEYATIVSGSAYMGILKASQVNNSFKIPSGTMTGGYAVISNQS